jgi:pimeloyl-ACP methyl ester carboxylesterase
MDGQAGRVQSIDLGGAVHYVDFAGPGERATVVLVHGLGGSHLNWELFAPLLTSRARVLAVDLPGFGLSEPGERPATVPANVAVLERFIQKVAGGPVILIGNSMGGMISVLLAGRAPELVRGLVLVDAALPLPLRNAVLNVGAAPFVVVSAIPGVGESVMRSRRRRFGPRTTVNSLLRLCGVDPRSLPPDLVDRSVLLIDRRTDVAGMDRAFVTAARSLLWVLTRAGTFRATMAAIAAPVLLVHGERDRLVPVAAARAAARRQKRWVYVELPGVGHVPQLQVPRQLADHVMVWMDAALPS